ncbi:MAG: CRISPR-associated protein Cas5 [Thermotogota bacterium]
MKAFSVDFTGDFALFKKNDANDVVHVSYNFIHKPVILGLFGAITGLTGYAQSGQGKHPEFYEKYKDLTISVLPHYYKPLKKTIVGFNNASGLANKGKYNDGATWQVSEQVLCGIGGKIKYTVFVLEGKKTSNLKATLQNYKTEFPLYFGKNEFFAHYENFKTYEAAKITESKIKPDSLILNSSIKIKETSFEDFNPFEYSKDQGYTIYENLPYDFDQHGFYQKDLFMFTQNEVELSDTENFYALKDSESEDLFNVQFV